jgi:GT2 family glycosyltransferase
MDLTVCILTWNAADLLVACLKSLRDIRRVNHISYEVIVVDNGSEDGSGEVVRRDFPEVEVIANTRNVGFAAGNNQALRKGRGRHFLLLNNDTILLDDCLAQMVDYLDAHAEVGIVGGRLLNADGSTQVAYYPLRLPSAKSCFAELFGLDRIWPQNPWGRFAPSQTFNFDKPSTATPISGACLMVRREVLEKIGLFDEGFQFWYEDVDFCYRCLQAGWKIAYVPEARVVHYGGASFSKLGLSENSLMRFRSLLRYFRKHFTLGRFIRVKMMVAVALVLRLPLLLIFSFSPSAHVRKRWSGVSAAYFQILREIFLGT